MDASIVRVPIKIRNPIQKDFCNCWGFKVFSSKSIPYLLMADSVSLDDFDNLLKTIDNTIPFQFSTDVKGYEDKALLALSMGIPVTIKTNKVLSEQLLSDMEKVPHSSIHVSINFLDRYLGQRLEPESSPIPDLREMMFRAKSWKTFTVLSMLYQPHLVPLLDTYEIIDSVRNLTSHITLEFPIIKDVEYHRTYKNKWESLKMSSPELFKQYFLGNVSTRSWGIRHKYKTEIINNINEYIKFNKMSLEVLEGWESENRFRHNPCRLSQLPLGLRPFFYSRTDSSFDKVGDVLNQSCPKCKREIF